MGETIKIMSHNILEDGTVTVTGDPDTGYPEARLYDRSRNLYWRDTVTEAKVFHVDQGASPVAVDMLFISGHNFDAKDMQWQWSDNDADWTDAVTDWTQDGTGDIVKTLSAAATHRYWRVTLAEIQNPLCAEIWMGLRYSFAVMAKPDPVHQYDPNVQWTRSIGGQERSVKLGPAQARRTYMMKLESADVANLLSVFEDLDHFSLPFVVTDKDGDTYLMRFDPVPALDFLTNTRTGIDLNLVEML